MCLRWRSSWQCMTRVLGYQLTYVICFFVVFLLDDRITDKLCVVSPGTWKILLIFSIDVTVVGFLGCVYIIIPNVRSTNPNASPNPGHEINIVNPNPDPNLSEMLKNKTRLQKIPILLPQIYFIAEKCPKLLRENWPCAKQLVLILYFCK